MSLMKFLLALALVVLVAAEFEFTQEFQEWKVKYNKVYETKEIEFARQVIWESNKKFVENHNANADKDGFTVSMNEFADLDAGEFSKMHHGPFQVHAPNNNNQMYQHRVVPKSIDWRSKGAVTPVFNQGQCSCWPWSTVGAIEGQHFIKSGNLVPLSVQQILDCSNITDETMDDVYKYLTNITGIESAKDYPINPKSCKNQCMYDPSKAIVRIKGFADVQRGSEKALMEAVANVGPVAVAVDASHSSFQMYQSGVYYSLFCSSTKLDHAMLVVGYGSLNGKDYWIVKNSWGVNWGMEGYILMARNRNNNCGIATLASYPIGVN